MKRILSGFSAFANVLSVDSHYEHVDAGVDASFRGSIRLALRARKEADFLVFNGDPRRLFVACLVFALLAPRPFRRCKLVSVDILLRPPKTPAQKILALFKRFFLKQVDLFILYFKNVDGYCAQFGIPRERIAYVPFKVNSFEKLRARRQAEGEGEYVLLAGETLRDHETFAEAVRRTGLPAMIVLPPSARGRVESMPWYRSPPPSLQIKFHLDGNEDTYLRYFERAKLVCLPRFKWDIASTGISAYLCAMALGKCVVISKGPGAEDVLSPEHALFFEPEDARSLEGVLRRGWNSDQERRRIAANGAVYAESLGGEEKLLGNILSALEISL